MILVDKKRCYEQFNGILLISHDTLVACVIFINLSYIQVFLVYITMASLLLFQPLFSRYFVALVERYRPLPYAVCQLLFVSMKKELLEDYRIRLVQLRKEYPPTSKQYAAILNTAHYLLRVLGEWREQPVSDRGGFFL